MNDFDHMAKLLSEMPFLTAPYNWRSILLSKIQEKARKSSRKGSAKEKRAA